MTPRKRGLDILVVLSLLLVPIAFATHSATITTTYTPLYETNPVNITIKVDNGLFSSASINNVNIQTSGFSIQSIVPLVGWTITNNNSINFLTLTDAISNWGSQNFGFSALAQNVNQNTSFNWAVTTTDTAGDSQANVVQLQILNDATPPSITGTMPGLFISGNNNELFSVDANDPETGIASSNLHLSNCDLIFNNATNSSSIVYSTISLSCTNGVCSSAQDLSSWNEGDMCFYYDVSNKGGETALTNNLTTIIDRTPPSTALVAPANNVLLNATSVDLQFTAQDNYDTQLDCNVVVNGNANSVATSQINNTYAIPVIDGTYAWSVSCTDDVGLTGTSPTNTFTVDNQGPNITIVVPAVNDRGSNVVIDTTITDAGSGVNQGSIAAEIIDINSNVTSVTISNWQITYPTTTATIPGTYTIRITAQDNLGYATIQTAQFRIRETYNIALAINPVKIDASTPNLTLYANLTGTIVRDDGAIPSNTIDLIEIVQNETVTIDNQTGAFQAQIEIPQTTGGFTITASYTNGIDIFTATTAIAVGPYCGNGVVDVGEQCDGSTIATCSSYGYSQGTVSCTAACTISTNQCSNPPQSGSGSSKRSRSSNFVVQNIVTPAIPVVTDTESSGIIEGPQQLQATEINNSTISECLKDGDCGNGKQCNNGKCEKAQTRKGSSIGIGAGWSIFTNIARSLNRNLIISLLVIGALLYIFGFRKKEDEWDRYFKRFKHN